MDFLIGVDLVKEGMIGGPTANRVSITIKGVQVVERGLDPSHLPMDGGITNILNVDSAEQSNISQAQHGDQSITKTEGGDLNSATKALDKVKEILELLMTSRGLMLLSLLVILAILVLLLFR